MAQGITGIRVDVTRRKVSVRALSKTLRGTGFTKGGLTASGDFRDKAAAKKAVAELLAQLLASTDAVRQ